MIEDRELFERAIDRFVPPQDAFERLVWRRARQHRNKRIAAGVLAAIVAVAGVGTLLRAFDTASRTPISPVPSTRASNGGISFVGRDESNMASVYVLDPIDGAPKRILDLDPACRRRGTAWCDPWIRSLDWSPD